MVKAPGTKKIDLRDGPTSIYLRRAQKKPRAQDNA